MTRPPFRGDALHCPCVVQEKPMCGAGCWHFRTDNVCRQCGESDTRKLNKPWRRLEPKPAPMSAVAHREADRLPLNELPPEVENL